MRRLAEFLILDLDINEIGITPYEWAEQCADAASQARRARLLSSYANSVDTSAVVAEYGLLDGREVLAALPWLYELYSSALLELAAEATGRLVQIDPNIASSINMNVFDVSGSTGIWHVDSNPLTGILYADTRGAGDGGRFKLY